VECLFEPCDWGRVMEGRKGSSCWDDNFTDFTIDDLHYLGGERGVWYRGKH
jgi:hypothetical protein